MEEDILNRVAPLILFGFTIIGFGGFFYLYDGALSYFNSILIDDMYYKLIHLGWRAMPVICLVVGIMCLIAAGVTHSRSRGVVE